MTYRSWIRVALAPAVLAAAAAWAPPASAGVKDEMMTWLKDADGKLVQLAEAIPDAKYDWRPGKGVRSTGEVFMHVAAANYGLPGFAGIAPPAGFKFDTFEQSQTKKADIVRTLKESIAHMEAGLQKMSDADMEKPVDLFGTKTTARGAYMLLLSHAHEHLGQAIAYARSNEVVPPWTAAQKAPKTETKN
ncbi:MAG TPA: DinB family protein [Candidatus Polarisedimenticolaceae bacterium]|nr:DinB family protein [Candidatus Polarisedimenticolaceae bacterium]